MKINNKLISAFSAELINRQASTQFIDSITDWFDGAVEGTLLRQGYDFRTLALTFLVTETTEDLAYKKISALTEELKNCNIRFDDIDLDFRCVLQGSAAPERVHNSQFKITYLLKNDWAKGQEVIVSKTFVQPNAQKLKVTYKRDWRESIGYYIDCFDNEDIYNTIAEETIYIDKSKIAAASLSREWDEFFLALGINLDKYKGGNDRNGIITSEPYSQEAAQNFFNGKSNIEIKYIKMRTSEETDIPKCDYPSVVWSTGEKNQYYFDLGVGQGWDIRDIELVIYGRFFRMNTPNNGSLFGGLGEGDPFNMGLQSANMQLYGDSVATPRTFKVFNSTSSGGGHFIIETLESISATPYRKYGIKASQTQYGYADIIFNGLTLDRIPLDSHILVGNLALMNGKQGVGTYAEATRVQIYYKGQKVKDLIPIASSVKNCFYNSYDAGLYDIDKMEFIPWSKADTQGDAPFPIMPLPDAEPPVPPAKKYTATINQGTGSGKYEEGALVTYNANPALEGQIFDKWTVQKGTLTIDVNKSSGTFNMPAEDVEITATYKEKPTEPEFVYYKHDYDIAEETFEGQNKKTIAKDQWDESADGPYAYDEEWAIALRNAPSDFKQWTVGPKLTGVRAYTDKWGRPVAVLNSPFKSTMTYIQADMADGSHIRLDFGVMSV